MKQLFIIIIIVIFSLNSYSQIDTLKIDSISKEEISLKKQGKYPAVITYAKGKMYFDITNNGKNLFIINKKHIRLKILNEKGLKYKKVYFSYKNMKCESYPKVSSYLIRAWLHNINEDGTITTEKIKDIDVKKIDSVGCEVNAMFEFSNAKVGSIIEYEIKTPSLELVKPETWYFQKELPVLYSEFVAQIPQNFEYKFNTPNLENDFEFDTANYKKILRYKIRIERNTYLKFISMSGKEYSYKRKNNDALVNLKSAKKVSMHLKQVVSNSESYIWKQLTKALMFNTYSDYYLRTPGQRQMYIYPPSDTIMSLHTWGSVNGQLLVNERFGLALVNKWDCNLLLKKVLKDSLSDIDKTKKIYNYVKKNMKWNKKYSIFADVTNNNVGKYFKQGSATSSEMNFVLMYLLKKSKIKVYPVLANTIDNEPVEKEVAFISQFKTTIALVEIDGKQILLDASLPKSKFKKISDKFDKKQMFVVRNKKFGWL